MFELVENFSTAPGGERGISASLEENQMSNKKLHHHLKRKILQNRLLVWAIVAMVLTAALLVSYIEVTGINFEREVMPAAHPLAWQSYRNYSQNFSLRFPPSWGIESVIDAIIFSDATGGDEVAVTVFAPSSEAAVRRTLDIGSEEKVKVGGAPAVRIKNMGSDDAYETVILVKTNQKLYKISGFGKSFDSIVSTIKFSLPDE